MEKIKQQKQCTPEPSSSEAAVKILTFTILRMSLFIWKKICMWPSHTCDIIPLRGYRISWEGGSPLVTPQGDKKSSCGTTKKKIIHKFTYWSFFSCFMRCWLQSTTSEMFLTTTQAAWGTNVLKVLAQSLRLDIICKSEPGEMSPMSGVPRWVVTVDHCVSFFPIILSF